MCMYPHYYMRPVSTALASVVDITGVVLATYGIPPALSVNDNYGWVGSSERLVPRFISDANSTAKVDNF